MNGFSSLKKMMNSITKQWEMTIFFCFFLLDWQPTSQLDSFHLQLNLLYPLWFLCNNWHLFEIIFIAYYSVNENENYLCSRSSSTQEMNWSATKYFSTRFRSLILLFRCINSFLCMIFVLQHIFSFCSHFIFKIQINSKLFISFCRKKGNFCSRFSESLKRFK